MRLTPEQVHIIIQTTRRGGDVDLLIESAPAVGLMERASIKNKLELSLQLPVDVLAIGLGGPDRPFVRIARKQAVKLNGAQHSNPHE